MSGSWGELWFDGDLVSEVYKFQAKVTYNKKDIGRNGEMGSTPRSPATRGPVRWECTR